jgi:glutamate/aspartate transport system permease protein
MNYQWNWGLLLKEPYAGWLLIGLGWTVALSIAGWLIALPLGTAIGIARTSSSRWVLGLSGFYVSVFRNIPLLLQMFVWFFVVPELLPAKLGL